MRVVRAGLVLIAFLVLARAAAYLAYVYEQLPTPREVGDLESKLVHLAWRAQALKHDLELLILGPTPPPACLHHFKPFDLSTALMTVHKDSSHNQSSPYKTALAGGRQSSVLPRRCSSKRRVPRQRCAHHARRP